MSFRPWLRSGNVDVNNVQATSQEAVRLLVRADWDLFKTYARRVRTFGPFGDCDDTWFYDLEQTPPDMVPLLPNIKVLCWAGFNSFSRTFGFLRLFLSPTVERLHIAVSEHEVHDDLVVLALAPLSCPNVRDVKLVDYELVDNIPASKSIYYFSQVLCQWTHLTNLICDRVTDDALVHLAQMQSLARLDIVLGRKESLGDVRSRVSGTPFPSLTYCRISCDNVFHPIAFITKMQLSPVELLVVCHFPDQSSTIEQLFGPLSTHPSRRELERFDIHSSKACFNLPARDAPSCPLEETLTIARLRPLLSFSRLRLLYINVPIEITLNDSDIIELAHAFPLLEELSLNGGVNLTEDPLGSWVEQSWHRIPHRFAIGWLVRPRVTFRGLYALIESCPCLRGLGISFDAEQNLDEVPDEVLSPNRHIQYLPVGNSPCGDPEVVARRLRSVLPNVTRIMGNWSPWKGKSNVDSMVKQRRVAGDRWDEVERLLNNEAQTSGI
ncbi:hypothetical protein CONPUDRAFT_167561 [Coniophora puteana RWD-64-598 SS2]|uniref:F-box domain-containing protein n=1 Tax=Coniophora puteana (strain RWD-64-598) TaxID=741705 RepID=A0A5M3MHT9_CONPW|nr:uncharacterized protein CONPUDRAFT_167561 [Coniophora puteana RWD-64-598 SS2]EIW78576.1 hypothetical protein CONPUDRAFT_167561 [Coniophora puteana RWD-64-598 SS2]